MIDFERYTLDNGLKLIVHSDATTPIVAVNILYNVGAKDEHEDRTGFAHLFEHLMFEGSVNVPHFDEPLQKVGGENNAFTNNDITNYYITLPKNNLETAMWLESDRMLGLNINEKSLDVQRHVVIEEFKQRYLNQPYGDAWLLLRPLAYTTHPYRWPTIGKDIGHIERANLDDVKDFFKRFYAPNNAIMVVAGDVEPLQIKYMVEKWFGDIPRGPENIRDLPTEPSQMVPRKLSVERKVPGDALYKVYHTCARSDEEFHTVDMISDLLARGHSSRLFNSLIRQNHKFTELDAYMSGDMDKGLFVFSGKTAHGVSLEEADEALVKELEKLKEELVPESELQKVKNKSEATLVFSEMSVLNKSMNLAYFELLGDASLINTEVNRYQSIRAEDIQREARRLFSPQNCSTLYYRAKV